MNASDSKDFRIVFMGTPEFAVPSLDLLVREFNVVAVITAPDKPAGRGQKLTLTPVKLVAQKYNIPVLQPTNLKAPDFISTLTALNPDLGVVVAFRMLPEIVWRLPRLGTINLHASLLPDFRGAAPIQRAIMAGVTETGVTTFFLQQEIDTGAIIAQQAIKVPSSMTGGELHNLLKNTGAELLIESVRAIRNGTVHPKPQVTNGTERLAPKIFPKDCVIDWTKPTQQVYNLIRALNPTPAAETILANTSTKILWSNCLDSLKETAEPGSIVYPTKNSLAVRCQDGWLSILELKPQGRKSMRISDFLNGLKDRPLRIG